MPKLIGLLGLALLIISGCADQGSSSNVIRVAISPASPPNLYEDNGRITGLDLEIFEGYCQNRGCTLNITTYDWQGMLGAVVSRQADVAFSAISITDERKKVMDFSIPYMENTWNLVSLKSRDIQLDDLADLKQYSIGYPRGMAYSAFISNDLEPKGIYALNQVKLYPSYNEVLSDLRNGNLDLAFLDGTVASVYRKSLPIQDSHVFSGFDRFGFAFPKNSALREDFDNYLRDDLGPERLQEIIDKWLN